MVGVLTAACCWLSILCTAYVCISGAASPGAGVRPGDLNWDGQQSCQEADTVRAASSAFVRLLSLSHHRPATHAASVVRACVCRPLWAQVGLVLDCDVGTLTVHKNGRPLGVMVRSGLRDARPLAGGGGLCWVVELARKGQSVQVTPTTKQRAQERRRRQQHRRASVPVNIHAA